jgi:hypothetical protein
MHSETGAGTGANAVTAGGGRIAGVAEQSPMPLHFRAALTIFLQKTRSVLLKFESWYV